ncbi:MAG: plastocyanin/azurin family copper-binding protein [Methanobacteriota archaeon]
MEKIALLFGVVLTVFLAGCIGGNSKVVEEVGILSGSSPTKTFVITGENFKFLMDGQEAPALRVAHGDKVRIEFTSTQGFHDWVVDEFNAATEKVSEGGSTSVEFIASEKGTFEYYCSVGDHRAQGMEGNLIVE